MGEGPDIIALNNKWIWSTLKRILVIREELVLTLSFLVEMRFSIWVTDFFIVDFTS